MGKESVKKSEASKLVLEADEWKTADGNAAEALVRALDDPVRRAVLKLLEQGPMRQSELAYVVSKAMGKVYGDSLLRYHLDPLERAGLVGFDSDPEEPRTKLIYRRADYRLQLKPCSKPEMHARRVPPRSQEEFIYELQRALGGKSG